MKWRSHLAIGFLVYFLILFVILLLNKGFTPIYSYPDMLGKDSDKQLFTTWTIILSSVLYMIGILVPDSDSDDRGSRIYHSVFFPIAYYFAFLERLLAPKLKFAVGHRQTLHDMKGVFFTSLITAILCYIILFMFVHILSIIGLMVIFGGLFIGQIVHLACDRIFF